VTETATGNGYQLKMRVWRGDDSGGALQDYVDQFEERHFEYLQLATVQYNVEIGMGRTLGLVHATPWSIHESVMPDSSDDDFRRMLFEAGTNVLAYGHIHMQHQRTLDTGLVVAVGSLGLPFDGDRRAMYTVIDAAGGGSSIEFQRLDYDVEKAIAEAQRQGGPNGESFANTLINARRPG
jgi:hypothetical protein